MPNASNIIQVEEVTKTFVIGEQDVQILKGVSFSVKFGEFVIIFGPSGCGKSTLLHIVLGLEKPSTGKVIFLDENIYDDTDEDYRSNFRKKHIGMVYQQPNWIKSLNVGENVAFPLMLLGMEKNVAFEKSVEMLKKVQMDKWAKYIPTELSSGQQQRVALARSLINNPEIIVADEPTGNLDFTSGQDMMQLLHNLNTEQKKTIVMVTHDLEYLKFASSAVRMLDGKIVSHYGAEDMDKVLSQLRLKRGVPGESSSQTLDLNKAEDTIHGAKPVETTKSASVSSPQESTPITPEHQEAKEGELTPTATLSTDQNESTPSLTTPLAQPTIQSQNNKENTPQEDFGTQEIKRTNKQKDASKQEPQNQKKRMKVISKS